MWGAFMHIKRNLIRRGAGFQLPELMVVLALLLLTAVLSAPTFQRWLLRDHVDQAARALLATLSYARSEASRLGRRVTVCRADGGGQCATASSQCGAGSHASADNWACGWLVMADTGAASLVVRFDTDNEANSFAERSRVLRRYPASDGLSIVSPAAKLSFTPPAGQLIGNFRSFEIAVTAAAWAAGQTSLTRCIRLAAGGRARITNGACGSSS